MLAQTTRFAPSPTGWLHLGHAYAALFAAQRAAGGRFLVRLEDIDGARARPEYEAGLIEDLQWLELSWEWPMRRQSEHFDDYRAGLQVLNDLGLLYPCFCTRREIQEEIARAGHAPHGPDGALYPGTCRLRSAEERAERMGRGEAYALRLDVAAAVRLVGKELIWEDAARGSFTATPAIFGDVVLARKDTPASYHLAVVIDDASQGVTLVTRGEDLLEATHLHRLLIELLRLPLPRWEHHRLILDAEGRRLAKRDDARSIRSLREQGWTRERLLRELQMD
jgi:glutamyl-Q tRNA(Asp) synthetase